MKLSILCCLTDEEELNKATIEVFEKMAAYGLGKNNKVRIGEEFANAAGEGSMASAEGSSTDIGDSDLSADDISQEKISMGEKKKHAEAEKEKEIRDCSFGCADGRVFGSVCAEYQSGNSR